MPNFETYRPQPESAPTPTLTITGRGDIHLNGVALRALGSPRAVDLLYDCDTRTIGVQPADPGLFPLHALRCMDGSQSIRAVDFLRHYGIGFKPQVDTTWPAVMDDGVLCAGPNVVPDGVTK